MKAPTWARLLSSRLRARHPRVSSRACTTVLIRAVPPLPSGRPQPTHHRPVAPVEPVPGSPPAPAGETPAPRRPGGSTCRRRALAPQPFLRRHVQVERQVGPQAAGREGGDPPQRLQVQPPSVALVGQRAVGIAVADHDLASRQRGRISCATCWAREADRAGSPFGRPSRCCVGRAAGRGCGRRSQSRQVTCQDHRVAQPTQALSQRLACVTAAAFGTFESDEHGRLASPADADPAVRVLAHRLARPGWRRGPVRAGDGACRRSEGRAPPPQRRPAPAGSPLPSRGWAWCRGSGAVLQGKDLAQAGLHLGDSVGPQDVDGQPSPLCVYHQVRTLAVKTLGGDQHLGLSHFAHACTGTCMRRAARSSRSRAMP